MDFRVELRVASSKLREAVAAYLTNEPLSFRMRLDLVAPAENVSADVLIVDRLPTGRSWPERPAGADPEAPGRLLLVLEDISHDDLPGLLRDYKSFGITLAGGPLDEIGDAIEAVRNGGYWLSPTAARRLREQGDAGPRSMSTRTPCEPLTPAEERVLALAMRGMSNKDIAGELAVAVTTVKTHVRKILRKTGHPNRLQLIASILGTD